MGTMVFNTRRAQLHSALVDAQRAREYLPLRDTETPYWDTYEKMTMWKLVNMMRQSHGRPFLEYEDVERAQQGALGHSDYTKKFALYCAELVDLEV